MPEILENIAIYHSKSLIEKSQRGDDRAFGKLVGLWFKRIYNFSLKYFGDHDLAMEATQQTFIVVHRKIGTLKDTESFKYWLYKITLNHCREEDRRQKRKRWFSIFTNDDVRQVESTYGLPDQEFQKKEKEEMMSELLRKLPEEQKEIIIMKEFEGLKFREIAVTLSISENTAKSRLYYGLSALKKLIEKSELNYKIEG